ncbi:MAG TPA: maleylpyruvate isomerase family mycothiol-dependent enzyme [Acidimicrobiia bacterium]
MTEQHALAYAELRARVADLVGDVDVPALERPAAATPGWRVRDVLAHMIGVTDDVVHGRLDGVASDPWTAAQVEKRRELPVAELLDEWGRHGPRFEELLVGAPDEIAGQALFDAVTHEQDVRQALARPGARDGDAMELSWDWFVYVRTLAGAPAIRFVTERRDDVAGAGEPEVTVRAPRFELLRATTGRRTAEEMTSYGWEPAPDIAILLAAPFFTIRTDSLGE